MTFGAFMAIFRTICYKYVYYYFTSTQFRLNFENEDNKQINQVTQDILKNSLIPIPPLQEQYRICGILDKSFSLLNNIKDDANEIQILVNYAKYKILESVFSDSSSYKSYYKNYSKLEEEILLISTHNKELKSRDVESVGDIPVVSQSKQLIDGYSNDMSKMINDVPVIIFGDHTRIIKYVDKPFFLGADGVKLLKAKKQDVISVIL